MIRKLLLLAVLVLGFLIYKLVIVPTGTKIGNKAPEIEALMTDGQNFQLSKLKGQYVLIDFWGSWCGPCLREMPHLRDLYTEFHDKKYLVASNFEILSIALEKSEGIASKLISRETNWPFHIIDINSYVLFAPTARLYGVTELPHKFLVGPDGIILKIDPEISEIRNFLREQLLN